MVELFNPYEYAFHEDPYPTYARLRAEAPVYRNEEFDFWALSRHADVLRAFRDVTSYSNAYGVSLDPAAFGPDAHRTMSFLAMDPPDHTRMRTLVNKAFTPRTVARLEDRIREITVEHLDPAIEQGTFDFIGDFAGKVPMDVISELIGVPRSDRAELRRLADLVVHRQDGQFDVPLEGQQAALEMVVYFADMVSHRRAAPQEDLTSELLDARIDGVGLTDDEMIGFLFLMVVAGTETTTKLLGAGQAPGGPGADPGLGRGDAPLRRLEPDGAARGQVRPGVRPGDDPRGGAGPPAHRLGQPRP